MWRCCNVFSIDMKINVLKGERYEVNPEEISVTFKDVKGVDEAMQELKDIVDFLQDPEKFSRLGAKLPKGQMEAHSNCFFLMKMQKFCRC